MKHYIFLLLTLSVAVALAHRNDTWSLHREKKELLIRTKRRWVLSTIEMYEEDKGPFPKLATRLFNDQEQNFDVSYAIAGHGVDEEPLGVFSINSNNGEVFAHKSVDREEYPLFHIKFDVIDKLTGQVVDRQLSFDIDIMDINDNAPLFEEPLKRVVIKENREEGLLPIPLSATDRDEDKTDNSRIAMRIVTQEPAYPKFGIARISRSENYQLSMTGCFDYDKVKEHKVIIEARDHGNPVLSSSGTILISIQDSNTHPPAFTKEKYEGEVEEMSENEVVVKLPVTDKDTPKTPGWRAKYTILKGNEDGHFKIETDPQTNEGILTVIKAIDHEVTAKANLLIAVENEEPLFVCGSSSANEAVGLRTADVAVTVIDMNDPPVFTKEVTIIHEKEEEEPGKVLYRPTVTDVDSRNFRFELARDPAKWMSIDSKTGAVKTVQKMDRDSPHVSDNIYTVVIHAIDDGHPPMTGTGTLLIHLSDKNDNAPSLVNKETHLCGNRDISLDIQAHDADEVPFQGPFTFILQGDVALKKQWKLDPDKGEKATLVSLKPLPFGTYTIPIKIEDQQGKAAEEDLRVVVCECGMGTVCKDLKEKSSALGGAGIATLFAGILACLLALCLCLTCQCNKEQRKPLYFQEDGNQTLIKYNEEGGSSVYTAVPAHALSPIGNAVAIDTVKKGSKPPNQMSPGFQQGETSGTQRKQGMDMNPEMGIYDHGMVAKEEQRNVGRNTIKMKHSQKQMSSVKVSELIGRRLQNQKEDALDFPRYHPQLYAYEGTGSACQSLDKLSLSNHGNDLDFLQHLGPKFNTLRGICHQAIKEKGLKV